MGQFRDISVLRGLSPRQNVAARLDLPMVRVVIIFD